jgi:CRISPR/Cas system-associated exonuclease Cas4 (RecB family)
MAKNLLSQVMLKKIDNNPAAFLDTKEFIAKLESGYTISRVAKFQKKKTFAPSTIAYSHGECPRYWYLAFDGGIFEDYADAFGVANMTNGTLSHGRIQDAMLASGVAKEFVDDNGNKTTEFKIISNDPPIFGYGDAMLEWMGDDIVGEIKTSSSEAFEYRKAAGKPKNGHLIQLLIYMKILGKSKGVIIYENKNNHELLVLPVEVTPGSYYVSWVNNAFDWMRAVRKAWTDRTMPEKNYRSNSKICKTCPLKAVCSEAGKGDIKIKSLEPLDETLSVL